MKRMEWCLAKVDGCKYPGPKWLEKKKQRLHVEIDELRMRASNKYRKILTPITPCGPMVRHWDKIIHLYIALRKIVMQSRRR